MIKCFACQNEAVVMYWRRNRKPIEACVDCWSRQERKYSNTGVITPIDSALEVGHRRNRQMKSQK